ncbi:DUF5801 repeats-in-toxin domain-containing protein [Pseudomonas sp. MBLB4123]|uniref:DUF5801 repeats-in-toxin domain-containing protein n=1 Tax=Pseudomonas sp. MBLB4123 TaxID=3451557 RepID=UPI003F74DE52
MIVGPALVDEQALDNGTNPSSPAEQASGRFIITSPDGVSALEVLDVNGVWIDVTNGGVVQGQYGTLTVDAAGNWTYTLSGNTHDHSDPNATGADDQVGESFLVRVFDLDGDVSPTVSLDVLINDDGPTLAEGEAAAVSAQVDEDETAAGISDGDTITNVASGAAGSLNTLVNFGADGPGSFGLSGSTSALSSLESQGLTSGGTALTYSVVGNLLTASAGTVPIFTLQVNADGSWTFSLIGPLDHPLADGNDDELLSLPIDFSGMLTAIDGDGDSVGAFNSGSFVIDVEDDVPVAVVGEERPTLNALVHEDVLSSPYPGNSEGGQTLVASGAAGSLHALVDFGADGPGDFGLAADLSSLTAQGLTSEGTALSYTVDTNSGLLTASANGNTIFTLQVNADGSWTFTLSGPLDHPVMDGNDNETLAGLGIDFSGVLTATDGDGDPLVGGFDPGSFAIDVQDDVPVLAGSGQERPQVSGLVHEDVLSSPYPGNSEGGQTLVASGAAGSLHALVDFGADGPGDFGLAADLSSLTAQGLTSEGTALSYTVDTNSGLLTASANGNTIFTLQVNADGSWTFTLSGPLDHPDMDGNDGETLAGLGIDFSGVLTATDGDGDPLLGGFDPGSFAIDVQDDVPVLAGIAQERPQVSGLVHEDVLSSPYPGNSEGGQTLVANGVAGSLHALVDFGADGPGDFGLAADLSSLTAQGLTSEGTALSYTVDTNSGLLTASANGNTIFTLQVNADGSWTFTLSGPLDHPDMDGNDGETLAGLGIDFSGVLTATDGDGDPLVGGFDPGSFAIDVEDDVPVASLSEQAPELGVDWVDESLPAFGGEGGDGKATAVLSAALVQAQFDSSFGADGPGTTSYSLVLDGDDVPSGLFAVDAAAPNGKGAEIVLNQLGNVITGSVGGDDYFTLTIDPATGEVTLALLDNIWHGDTTDHDDGQVLELPAGVLELVQTLTDGDGDSDSASIDLGVAGVFRFEDDGPDASLSEQAPELGVDWVDESLPAFGGEGGDGKATAVLSAALVQAQFDSSFGADGPGTTSYSLVLDGDDVPSGLFAVDAAAPNGKGAEIVLNQLGNVITGSVGGNDYFTLTIDPATGEVTLALLDNIWHGDTTDHDDGQVLELPAGVLELVQTLTDGDGDSDSASIDLGVAGVFRFEDDGPDASLSEQAPELGVDWVDESLPAFGGEGGDGKATAVLSAALVQAQFDSSFGADGPGTTSYSLVLDGDDVPSGLFAVDAAAPNGKGAEIVLNQLGNVITGSVGGNDYFTLTIDPATGEVTLALLDNIWHGDTTDHDDGQVLELPAGVLELVQTLTDGDGDSDSASIDLGVAGVFRFEDDGPDASLSEQAPGLGADWVDESLPAFGGEGGDGKATAVLSAALVQAQFDSSFGADGPGTTSYSLVLDGDDVPSGLFAVDAAAPNGKGAEIVLNQLGNVITGSVGGNDYFTLTIDPATGEVTLALLDNIWHGDTTDHDDGQVLELPAGVLELVQTLTDGDGDSDSASIDLGVAGVFRFEDDGPDASLSEQAPELGADWVDESLPAFGGEGGDGKATAVLSAALVQAQFDSSFGADGPGTTSYSLVLDGDDVPSGLFAVDAAAPNGKGAEIVLNQLGNVITGSVGGNDYFTLTIDPATGEVTLALLDNIWHGDTTDHDDGQVLELPAGVLELVQTLTDGDGDSDSASIDLGVAGVFRFEDDGPDASLSEQAPELGADWVDESLPAFGGEGGDGKATAVLSAALVQAQFDSSFGADGPGTTSYSLVLDGDDVPSGLFAVDAAAPDGKGAEIVLNQLGNVITGSVGGNDYFTLTIDPATGEVTLALLDNIWHGDTTDHDDGQVLELPAGVLELVQTLTDGDGDSDSASIDLGVAGVFRFEDDGPVLAGSEQARPQISGLVHEDVLSSPYPGNSEGGQTLVASGAAGSLHALVDFGADGPGDFGLAADLSSLTAQGLSSEGTALSYTVDTNSGLLTASANGHTIFTLQVNGNGSWTFTLSGPLDHPDMDGNDSETLAGPGIDFSGVLTATDGDGDPLVGGFDPGSFAIDVQDDVPVQSGTQGQRPTVQGQVQEDALTLADGAPHEGNDEGGQTTSASGGVGALNALVDFGADGPGEFGLSDSQAAIDSMVAQGLMSDGTALSYSVVGNLLTASSGAQTIFTLQVNADGSYSFNLEGPLDHPLPGSTDDNQLLSLPIDFSGVLSATDGDGDPVGGFAPGSFTIDVEDDIPLAQNDSASVLAGQAQDFNVVFVLDFSGSINNTELNQMLQAVRAAGQTLFNGTTGDVNIQLVAFSSTATSYPQVTDFASLDSLIASLNPAEGGTRPFNGQTDFTDAITETMAVYSPIAGWSNQVFFISDGNPNQQTGPGGTSLTSATAAAWDSFVNGNDINVTSIGVGGGINTARLQDIDVDGSGAPILVGDFDDLVDTLVDQILGDVVSGNVLLGSDNAAGGGDDDAFGADGPGYIQSIVINGVTYTWDGVGNIDASTGPDIAGSQLTDIDTAEGGKLSFDFATGAWSYQAPVMVNGDKTETFTYTIVDNDGDPASANLTIHVEDSSPVIARVDEDELPGGITDSDSVGTVATGSLSDLLVGPSVSAQFGLSTNTSGLAPAASGGVALVYSVAGDTLTATAGMAGPTVFTLQVQSNGDYTFTLSGPLDHPLGNGDDNELLVMDFASILQASSGGDPVPLAGNFLLQIEDDVPTTSANPTVRLDDDALSGGIPDGIGDDVNALNTSGTLGFNYGADGPGSVQWLTSGSPAGFTYVKAGDDLLIMQGATTVVTVTLDPSTGAYSVTQNAPISHPEGDDENNQSFNLTYQVTDKDGDTANGSLTVDVDDDTPMALNDVANVAEASGQDFNVVFVLDFSGSIDNTELNQMLQAVRAAGQTLFSGTTGDVNIQLVAFSSTATSYPQVTDFASLDSLIASLNPAEGGTRPFNGQTDFTDAIIETMAVYSPIAGWSNQVFFISDGNPNQQTGPGGTSLTSATATAWNNFVDDNGINVTSIGVGNGIDTDRLQDIDVDGMGAPILVNDFDDLIDTLVGQVLGGLVSGNVLLGSDNAVGGGDDDGFGADGPGYIQSIVINGVTYTWDGVGNIDVSSGPDIAGNQLSEIATAEGGKLSFNFATGAWSYVAPQTVVADTSESFSYTIVDADGDPSTALLTINIEDASPVIGMVDEDELPNGITDGDAVTTVASGNLSELLVGTNVGQFGLAPAPVGLPSLQSGGVNVTYAVAGNTLTASAGALTVFTLVVQPNGDYTFTLLGPLDHPNDNSDDNELLTLNLVGALVASDGVNPLPLAGDLLIQVEDDVPRVSAGSAQAESLQVDESNLTGDTTSNFSSLFNGSYGADGPGSTVYGLKVSAQGVDSGLDDSLTGQDILLYLEGGNVVGKVGSASGAVAFSVSVNSGTGAVTLDQARAVLHSPNSGPDQAVSLSAADLVQLTSTVTDWDGDSASASLNLGFAISFRDDAPTAFNQNQSGQASTSLNTNLLIVLDNSGSMGNGSGVGGMTRLEVAKNALLELFEQYDALGNVKVSFVSFSTNATIEEVWVNIADAKAALLALNPTNLTNYDDALIDAITAYGQTGSDGGKLASGNVQNVAYFLSDGFPNAPSGDSGISNAPGTAAGWPTPYSNGGVSEEQAWINFLTANNIRAYALGMGTGVDASALNPIAYNGTNGGSNTNAIVVNDFNDLTATLVATAQASPLIGNLTTGGGFGADGGFVRTLLVEGKTYTYDKVTNSFVASGPGPNNGSLSGATLTVSMGAGAGIAVNMLTGAYTYTPPSAINMVIAASIAFTLMDNDGDTASANLNISISPGQGPMVIRDDLVLTNVDTQSGQDVIDIPKWALLANDSGPSSSLLSLLSVAGATSGVAALNGDYVRFTEGASNGNSGRDGGTFNYAASLNGSTAVDSATVTLDRGQHGENTLDGTFRNEILLGRDGVGDVLNGNDGDDILIGLGGGDTLNGGNGNDILAGGAGNDTLNGGNGVDTASYIDATAGVSVNLGVAVAQNTGGAGTDTLNSIENLVGSSFADTLTGNGSVNYLFGGAGNDTLLGNGGDDFLVGGLGGDIMTGGSGKDTYIWQKGGLGGGVDHITDFNVDLSGVNSDTLDLSQLLSDVGADSNILQSYLDFAFGGTTTTIDVRTVAAGPVEQQVVLDNVNLSTLYGTSDEATLIANLLDDHALKVDTV